jgi:hypothetical protein
VTVPRRIRLATLPGRVIESQPPIQLLFDHRAVDRPNTNPEFNAFPPRPNIDWRRLVDRSRGPGVSLDDHRSRAAIRARPGVHLALAASLADRARMGTRSYGDPLPDCRREKGEGEAGQT